MNLNNYLLDATGFLRMPGFVSKDAATRALELLQDRLDQSRSYKIPILDTNPFHFLRMINSPTLFDICRSVLGVGFRLDCAFVRAQPDSTGLEMENLHGGPGGAGGFHIYGHQAGMTMCSQLSVGFPLTPQGGARGGFVYIPGSHKTHYPVGGSTLYHEHFRKDLNHPAVVCPELEPGDMFLFPEVIIHGAKRMADPAKQRATLYFMFVPGNVMWKHRFHSPEVKKAAAEISGQMARLVEDPYVAKNVEHPLGSTENTWRPPT